ncbi:MAG: alpha/beta hydrolase [Chloroflexota bacterium]
MSRRRLLWQVLTLVLILLAIWILLPLFRAVVMVEPAPFHSAPRAPSGLPGAAVSFHATDGTKLAGRLIMASSYAPTIVLVDGFKADSSTMVPYARFLHRAGFNALLYDSRGTGGSVGLFTVGARGADDVEGAIAFLRANKRVRNRRLGLLGVSMGAGVVIDAASRDRAVLATVADSAYVDQSAVIQHLQHLQLGKADLPLAPIALWTVDTMTNSRIESFRPIDLVARIAPRALFLIHSRHDTNVTTPLGGARRLFAAAGRPKAFWIAPRGDHAAARAAQPGVYARRVIAFFRRYLGRPS